MLLTLMRIIENNVFIEKKQKHQNMSCHRMQMMTVRGFVCRKGGELI